MSTPTPTSARRRTSAAQIPVSARRPSSLATAPSANTASSARGASARARRGSEIAGSSRGAADGVAQSGRRNTAAGEFNSALQSQGNAMKVYVRVRPFSERETAQKMSCHSTIAIDPENPAHVTVLEPAKAFRPVGGFKFTRCFWSVFEKNEQMDERTRGAVETYLTGGMNAAPADKRRRSRAGSMLDPNAEVPSYTGAGSTATLAEADVPHPPYSGQDDVYKYVGKPILETVLDGYNGCIFAYGQTGSGKTFTMMGYVPGITAVRKMRSRRESMLRTDVPERPATSDSKSSMDDEFPSTTTPRPTTDAKDFDVVNTSDMDPTELQGIIPRICSDIFESLRAKREEDASRSYRVEVSYYEIYNEKVFDLIKPQKDVDLKIRNNPTTGPFVDGITIRTVRKEEDITKVIRRGAQERHTAQTTYNDRSSRSHAILNITITQLYFDELNQTSQIESKLNLVDLAGSERTGAGGAEGLEKQTGIKINLSLTVLGRVIDCLADLSQNKSLAVPVPYRDSNLTWLLSDSIGGNSQTSMIATVSPHTINYEEMKQTLRYASRAKQIIVHARRNEDPQMVLIRNLRAEVERLSQLLKEAGGMDFTRDEFLALQQRCLEAEAAAEKSATDLSRLRAEMAMAGLKDPTSSVNNGAASGAEDASNAPMTASGLRATIDSLQQQLEDANKELADTHQQLLEAVANKADPVEVREAQKKLQDVEKKYYVALEDHADKEAVLTTFDQFYLRWTADALCSTFDAKAALVFSEFRSMLQANLEALQEYARRADVDALLSVNDVNQRHEDEIKALMSRHRAALDTADEERAVREAELEQKHNDALMAMRNRLESNQRIFDAEKNELEEAQQGMRLHYEDELTKARMNYNEETQRLRDSIANGGTDRQKQGEALRQQQQRYEELIAQTKKDAETARRKLEADIDKIKTQRVNEATERNEAMAEKDRQLRKVEQEGATMRRDNLSIQSEAKKMQREAQEKTRKMQVVQDELVNLSANVLQEWAAAGLNTNPDTSKTLVNKVNALRAYLQDNEVALKVSLSDRLADATLATKTNGETLNRSGKQNGEPDKELDDLRDVVSQLRRKEEERKAAAQRMQRDMYEQVSRARGFQVAKDDSSDAPAP